MARRFGPTVFLLLVALALVHGRTVKKRSASDSCLTKNFSPSDVAGDWKLFSSKNKLPEEVNKVVNKLTFSIEKGNDSSITMVLKDPEGNVVAQSFKYFQVNPKTRPGFLLSVVPDPNGKEREIDMQILAFKPKRYLVTFSEFGSDYFYGAFMWAKAGKGKGKLTTADITEMAKHLSCAGITDKVVLQQH